MHTHKCTHACTHIYTQTQQLKNMCTHWFMQFQTALAVQSMGTRIHAMSKIYTCGIMCAHTHAQHTHLIMCRCTETHTHFHTFPSGLDAFFFPNCCRVKTWKGHCGSPSGWLFYGNNKVHSPPPTHVKSAPVSHPKPSKYTPYVGEPYHERARAHTHTHTHTH